MKDDKKIEIEDLLKLKRLERPAESEWREFDARLKQRMLMRVQKKDPVWRRASDFALSKKILTSGALASSVFAAVALIFVVSGTGGENLVSDDFAAVRPKLSNRAELPSVGETFVASEIPIPVNKDETHMEITMSVSEASVSQFASSNIPLFVHSSF